MAQTDPASTLYTNNQAVGSQLAGVVTAASTHSQLIYRNQDGIFPLSFIRAVGAADSNAVIKTNFNLNQTAPLGIVHNSTGRYTVNMVANAVANSNYGVVVSTAINTPFNVSLFVSYAIVTATQFTLLFITNAGVLRDPDHFSFMVFQF